MTPSTPPQALPLPDAAPAPAPQPYMMLVITTDVYGRGTHTLNMVPGDASQEEAIHFVPAALAKQGIPMEALRTLTIAFAPDFIRKALESDAASKGKTLPLQIVALLDKHAPKAPVILIPGRG